LSSEKSNLRHELKVVWYTEKLKTTGETFFVDENSANSAIPIIEDAIIENYGGKLKSSPNKKGGARLFLQNIPPGMDSELLRQHIGQLDIENFDNATVHRVQNKTQEVPKK